MRRPLNHAECGISLLETTIALTLFLLASFAGLFAINQLQKQSKASQTAHEIESLMQAGESYAYAHWDYLKYSDEIGTELDRWEEDSALWELPPLAIKRLHPQMLLPFLPAGHGLDITDCRSLNTAHRAKSGKAQDLLAAPCHRALPQRCRIFLSGFEGGYYQIYLMSALKPRPYKNARPKKRDEYDHQFYLVVQLIAPGTGNRRDETLATKLNQIVRQTGRGVRVASPISENIDLLQSEPLAEQVNYASHVATIPYALRPCLLSEEKAPAFAKNPFFLHIEARAELLRRPPHHQWHRQAYAPP